MLQEAMRSDVPIGTFPAGSCSRIFDGKLQDRPWHKTFVSQAIANERDIVPLHYVGQNSRHFYWIWHIKEALKMKFDPGQALLPDELFRAHGSHFKVIVGEPISWQSLRDSGLTPQQEAQRIRALSYQLRDEYDAHTDQALMFTTPIIAPVSADLIRQELTPDKLLRATNKGGNEIYVFHASTAPETMREIGRLREEAFRFYGGGTGRDCDVDEFDLVDDGYRQLIVWDPAEGAILGGYRFMFGDEVQMDEVTGRPRLATTEPL